MWSWILVVTIWSFINLGFFRHMLLYDHHMKRIGGFRHDMRKCGLPFVRLLSVGKMASLDTLCDKSRLFVQKFNFVEKLVKIPDFFGASKYFDDFSSKIELMDKKWVLAPVCDRHKVKLIQYRIEEECGRQEITTLE